MTKAVDIRGRSLAVNTLINLSSSVLPLVFVVFTTHYIVNGLGTERYGVLSLAWVILGYFSIFDFGLGPAVTKFVSEVLAKGDDNEVATLVWTAVFAQLLVGLIAGVLLVTSAPYFVKRVFNIPPALQNDATRMFYLTGLFIPLSFVSSSFNGVLAASQRFGLLNLTKVPTQLSVYIAGIIAVYLGYTVTFIVALVLVFRLLTLIAQLVICFRIVPNLGKIGVSKYFFRRMAQYGVWITLSNSVNPLIAYVDRFLIGSLLGMTALAYYSVPFDLAARLWVISTSLTMTLFPAFSFLDSKNRSTQINVLYIKSIKYLTLTSGSIVCLLIAFAYEIIEIWVGAGFAANSTRVFQILLFSMIFDFPGIISSSYLEGTGRPKHLAVVKLLYLPVHVGLSYFLIKHTGISGAALGLFALRSVYSGAFSVLSVRTIGLSFPQIVRELGATYLCLGVLLVMSIGGLHFDKYFRLLFMFFTLSGTLAMFWYIVMDNSEKNTIKAFMDAGGSYIVKAFGAK